MLDALGLDHLVRFFARGPADSFDPTDEPGNNGLRVTQTLFDVEFAVCASREGGSIDVFDLRDTPALILAIEDIGSGRLRRRLEQIVF